MISPPSIVIAPALIGLTAFVKIFKTVKPTLENERSPYSRRRHAFHIEAIHKRSEESPAKSTPGNTHELGDKSRRVDSKDD